MVELLINQTAADGSTGTADQFQARALQQNTPETPFQVSVNVTTQALTASPQLFSAYVRAYLPTYIDDDFRLFTQLVSQWHANTRASSSIDTIIYDDAYQEIIGFGKQALPWIFRLLEKENDHWYWALTCITHEWPVPDEEEGKMPAMRARWLAWARERGYLL